MLFRFITFVKISEAEIIVFMFQSLNATILINNGLLQTSRTGFIYNLLDTLFKVMKMSLAFATLRSLCFVQSTKYYCTIYETRENETMGYQIKDAI